MAERSLYPIAVWAFVALGLVLLPVLLRRIAPYGRHTPARAGPAVASRIGWLVMELPSVLVFATCFLLARPRGPVPWCGFCLWELHYVYRALIYPFLQRAGQRPMPLSVVASAFVFTSVNGYLNGRAVSLFAPRPAAWLGDPRFICGVALFLCGLALNVYADRVLRHLRAPGETGYKIPRGGPFEYVSCPNYLGEIIEWCGWALATWTPAGLAFALWTFANLAPRALAHHRWYQATFPDYPRERRALIPGLL